MQNPLDAHTHTHKIHSLSFETIVHIRLSSILSTDRNLSIETQNCGVGGISCLN